MVLGKKTGLGKGLGAIFEEVEDAYNKDIENAKSGSSVKDIKLEDIEVNPFQPRKTFDQDALQELSFSIQKHGLLQPVLVIKTQSGFMLIAGERRFRASKLAGLDTIKAVVGQIPKESFREIALIENIQRENLNAVELARSYKELIEDYGITHEELASIVHKSRTHVTNTMRMLHLSDYAVENLEQQNISQGHGKILVGLDDRTQKKIVDTIINQNLNVRQAEAMVKNVKEDDKVFSTPKSRTASYDFDKLKGFLDSSKVKYALKKDKLVFTFSSQEDVDNLISQLG